MYLQENPAIALAYHPKPTDDSAMETKLTLTDKTPYYLVDSHTGALVKEYAYGAYRYILTFQKP